MVYLCLYNVKVFNQTSGPERHNHLSELMSDWAWKVLLPGWNIMPISYGHLSISMKVKLNSHKAVKQLVSELIGKMNMQEQKGLLSMCC